MRRIAWSPLFALLAAHAVFGQSPELSGKAGFRDAVAPLVRKLCFTCHGEQKPEGGLSLVGMTSEPKTAAELANWRNVFDKLAGREMPPPDSEQPSDAERRRAARWIAATLKASGVAVDEGKWLAPVKGNHVDHVALFPGKSSAPGKSSPSDYAATNARLWRLTGQAYEDYMDKLLKRFVLPLKNYGEHKITAPWNFTPQRDFPDYASAHRVGEAEIEYLLRNASLVAAAMIKRHAGNTPSYGGYIKELATLVKADQDATPEQADAVVAPTFRELFGRSPTARETQRYGQFVRETCDRLGGQAAAEQLLIALLCQTELIYRVELPIRDGVPQLLDSRALARAIAFALTDTVPDEPLATAAIEGRLATREQVESQVRRILDDASIAKPRLLRFFREYFGYAAAPGVFKDEVTLQRIGIRNARGWNPDYFVSDADRIVLSVLEDDQDVLRQLLTTTRTFVMTVSPDDQVHTKKDAYRLQKPTFEADEQTVIKVYEVPIATRSDWAPDREYEFPAGKRMGLLTHPAWLVAQSGNFDNHAIHRGQWIRERLLGGRIPELPITVNAMLPDEPHRTLRERMQVTRAEYCWSCHRHMDPLGLPFEQFDHFGRFRTEEQVVDAEATNNKRNLDKNGAPKRTLYKDVPLDTTGEVEGGIDPSLNGPVKGPFELIQRLASSEHVEQVFVRHAFRYFLGRNETLADGPALVAAHRTYRTNDGSMKALVVSLLTSEPFLYRITPTTGD